MTDNQFFNQFFDAMEAQLLHEAATTNPSEDEESMIALIPTMWKPFATILSCRESFPRTAAAVEDLAHSVVQSLTSNMLLAQQAELKKLTAEVGALKGALATRPVAAAPVAPAPAAPPRASKATYASRVAQPAPAAPPAVPRMPASATPCARHDEGRLILKVTPSPAISRVVRNATATCTAINTALADLTAARAPHPRLGVSGVGLTRSGNVVVFAMPGLTAVDSEPHLIASALLPQEAAFAGAARDSIWYKAVIPDAIPPDPSQPLPLSQVLQAEVEDYIQHRFSWAAPPIWHEEGQLVQEQQGQQQLGEWQGHP
ncbi:hypothetical protein AURDEDRAFT_169708 [Auricularia subglabra TFB-10046 SS5]|nr:hypothetical protein AURDEDRAFT_169708 [Auricularia subglabra TFB-10046 SS5]